jgi:hypothetical protein
MCTPYANLGQPPPFVVQLEAAWADAVGKRQQLILGRLVEENAKDLSDPALLPVTISARECHQRALAQGWRALDSSAREEILQLTEPLL